MKKRINKSIQVKAASLCLLIAASALLIENASVRKKRWWVKPWLNRKKGNMGIMEEFLDVNDLKTFENFLRMDKTTFDKLLKKISHRITKYTFKRDCISAKDKQIITLRYLATGESFRSLMYNYRISESAISLFVPITCKAIYEELKNDYLKVPNTAAEWLEISRNFENKWNMPNVIGALDGKHVIIKAPVRQGSAFYNYKDLHSIVLLALVDANYNFIYVNIGVNGRISDGGVYWESDLSTAIEQNLLNMPEDKPLPGREMKVPHVIVADSAFALSSYLMKPFPFRGITREQRIYNYRLSRARRVVENAFGILANRFRILINTIPLQPDKAKVITQACCALHNFLRKESKLQYIGQNVEEDIGPRYRFIYGLSRAKVNRPRNEAITIRQEFTNYFNGCGSVAWQNNVV